MIFVRVRQNGKLVHEEVLERKKQFKAPLFEGEEYLVDIYDIEGNLIKTEKMLATTSGIKVSLPKKTLKAKTLDTQTIIDYINQLISKDKFDQILKQKICIIKKIHRDWKYNEDQIRGGRLEQLIYTLFLNLQKKKIVDKVFWSGRIGEYDIAYPMSAEPDLIVKIDDLCLVIEVTVIYGIRRQWAAEGASVPDHVRKVAKANPKMKTIGIFVAPSIHRELKNNLDRFAHTDKIPIICKPLQEFSSIISTGDKEQIKKLISSND